MLVSVELGESVTTIGHSAFTKTVIEVINHSSLEIAPRSDGFGDKYRAFIYCYSIKSVYYRGSAEQWANVRIADGNSCLIDAKHRFLGD